MELRDLKGYGQRSLTRLPRVSVGDTQRVLLLSILIGVFAGLLVVCFHIAIDVVSWWTVGIPAARHWSTVLWPAVGAATAAALVRYVFRAAKGSGVVHTKAAVHVYDGRVDGSTVPGKFTVCAIAIGSGNSLGPEDPALQMGAGIASLIGRLFRLPREHMRRIAPVGAAAGIAAAFNTPITAVLFVIEEVVGAWSANVLGSILLAAVSAVVVSRSYLGDEPLFRVPDIQGFEPADLIVYAAIGVVGGVASVLYVRLMLWLKRRGDPHDRPLVQIGLPFIAGLFVGAVGLWLPQVMGPGYLSVDNALHGRFDASTLLLLAAAKIIVTAMCFAAGTPGGLFAPTLFAGAMLGGGIDALAQVYWPHSESARVASVLVGMGTFFAGVFRAPMTSIFMVFEVSASYQIILPAMIANTIGYLIGRRWGRAHLFDELARMEGMELPSLQEQREMPALTVEDAMSTAPIVLSADVSFEDARTALAGSNQEYLVIRLAPLQFAALHRSSLEPASATRLVDAYGLTPAPRLYPDINLEFALRTFGSRVALPIVRRNAPDEVAGLLTLDDVARVFHLEGWPPKPPSEPPPDALPGPEKAAEPASGGTDR